MIWPNSATREVLIEIAFPVALTFAFGFIAGLFVGKVQVDSVRQDAVKAGAAKWTADDNGSVSFEWIQKAGAQ